MEGDGEGSEEGVREEKEEKTRVGGGRKGGEGRRKEAGEVSKGAGRRKIR